MSMDRLFGIVNHLVRKGTATAAELAEEFEVSVRTIYRDVDALCSRGIPVCATQGKGGGLRLMKNYVIDKALFNEEEQAKVLMALKGVASTEAFGAKEVLSRMEALFTHADASWIEVDFSLWGKAQSTKELFEQLKQAVLDRRVIRFRYFNSKGDNGVRTVEPCKLAIKGQGYYLYAYCRERQDFRFFKLTRMQGLEVLGEGFCREVPQSLFPMEHMEGRMELVELTLRIHSSMAFRVYDEFSRENIRRMGGDFMVQAEVPKGEWLYSHLLSYGDKLEVLAPERVRDEMRRRLSSAAKRYLS